MSIHAALVHTTRYEYDRPIQVGPQVIRLRPAPHCRTPVLGYSLKVEPATHFLNWQQDPFGNFLARVVIPEKTKVFSVSVDLVADMAVINPFDFFVEDSVQTWPFPYDAELRRELQPYLTPDPAGPRLAAWLERQDRRPQTTIDFLCDLNRRVQKDIQYLIRMEPGVQTPEETLARGQGSCRDSGWLLVQIARHLGLAARFVSGYLIQLTPDIKALDGPSGTEVDFTDLHAWAEIYLPGAGWIGFDPTSGLMAGEGHIPLAATPAPSSAAPITGAHEAAEVSFSFKMAVTRIAETPRVTKPYTEAQWESILNAGAAVDKRLEKGDVRLSMGGEPTFVSIDDMEGAEWNTAAVGPTKRGLADALLRRLHKRFGQGGLLHYGQGKWYPGEQLPRWAFGIHWRTDGLSLWENADLLAAEHAGTEPEPGRDASRATITSAQRLAGALCDALGLAAEFAVPAYEDAAHFALVEQKLAVNVTVADNKLQDPAERARLVRVFDQGLATPTALVLPVMAWTSPGQTTRWVSERWALRREKLFLIPGDSPAGFRLPLASLPWLAPWERPDVLPPDPYAPAPAMPDRNSLRQSRKAQTRKFPPSPPGVAPAHGSVRTAVVIEPRDGYLCVFMPPCDHADDYAALVACVEEAAGTIGQPVRIEGYEPPRDTRLQVIKVTPDPGVIEVNVQPTTSWAAAVDLTTALYEEARLSRLGTEKFMLDGRHAGTGGGNHIVFGGLSPEASPFLRRPDLLASVIAYWQNHPALSFLFCGLFIGPTSQAPRVDEARHESLYELEIALASVPVPDGGALPGDGAVPPWLVDRLFRNLLTDVTGNTHRAEICIDKLYSPDGPTGRLGLVEFRSFEMPPHGRMSLAQQLLLRALIAMFWEKPYRARLVRWGTRLHDQFMLPHFVWQDLLDVVGDLASAGFAIDPQWFRPHLEFRFPVCGSIVAGGLQVEVRQALEPWHVLGEEGAAGGTARYVDSSLERVQVLVDNRIDDRHVVTCNGQRLPLSPTGAAGQAVCGVRFRAWQPPSALHPNIKPHVPLVIDVVDTWTGRSLGGCRYHVAHPGGRNFEIFPVNAYEAEGRRLARFEAMGHTPGALSPEPVATNVDYPLTLDLRRI